MKTIEPEQAREMLAGNEATAVDIRDGDEWREGHIAGARHAPEDELDEALEQIDPEQTVLLVCESGDSSAKLAEKLSGGGGEDGPREGESREFASLEGGMSAWRSADMPMQPSHDPDDDVPI